MKSIIFVSGYVKDETGKPIRNAQVFILEKGQVTRTNAEGFF
ncbi:MAG: carboxypeptidase-like regulatory domain-containing protein [Flavobacteriaceae bacterium]